MPGTSTMVTGCTAYVSIESFNILLSTSEIDVTNLPGLESSLRSSLRGFEFGGPAIQYLQFKSIDLSRTDKLPYFRVELLVVLDGPVEKPMSSAQVKALQTCMSVAVENNPIDFTVEALVCWSVRLVFELNTTTDL